MYNPFTLVGYSGHTFDAMIMLQVILLTCLVLKSNRIIQDPMPEPLLKKKGNLCLSSCWNSVRE